jgi:hypothetical protein
MNVAAKAVAQRLNADTSDRSAAQLPCACCSKLARYVDRRAKTFTTALGEMTLERAYFFCDACKVGFFPRDRALRMEQTSLSPALTRMSGTVGAMVSFQEGSALLTELAGVAVNAKQVERTAEALGSLIACDEKTCCEAASDAPQPKTLYLGMDGTGVPMREEELSGRSGKQPDGSAKTREVKLCVVWSAEGRDKDGCAVRDQGSVSYSAAIESAANNDVAAELSDFGKRVDREAKRRSFDLAERQVVLGDGAAWIWNIAAEQFPKAIQIVDRFHVKQHLSDVSKAVYGANTDLASQWAHLCFDALDRGEIDNVIAALDSHAEHCDLAKKCVKYLENNRHRMRYAEFKAQGLCTSSGVVEAGCKVAIGTRLKRAGMRWTVRGANAIIALRCCKLSGRFEDYWERSAQQESAAT